MKKRKIAPFNYILNTYHFDKKIKGIKSQIMGVFWAANSNEAKKKARELWKQTEGIRFILVTNSNKTIIVEYSNRYE